MALTLYQTKLSCMSSMASDKSFTAASTAAGDLLATCAASVFPDLDGGITEGLELCMVRDADDLALVGPQPRHRLEQGGDELLVGLIQGSIHLVQNQHCRHPRHLTRRQNEGQGKQRALPARQLGCAALQTLAIACP